MAFFQRTPSLKTPPLFIWPQLWLKSIIDIRIYRTLIHTTLFYSFLSSFLFYGILAFLSAGVWQWKTLPQLQQISITAWNELVSAWPNDMTLRYQNGKIDISGVDEPIIVSYPTTVDLNSRLNSPEHFAIIQTEKEPAQALSDHTALFLISENGLTPFPPIIAEYTAGNASLSELTPWKDLLENKESENLNFVIEKTDLEKESENITATINLGWQFVLLPYFLTAWWGVWIARIILLAFYTLIGQSLFWLFGTKIRYEAMYRLGVHTLPVVELVLILWRALYTSHLQFVSYWWIWLIFLSFLAWDNRKNRLLRPE